jgi:hypothetical protein
LQSKQCDLSQLIDRHAGSCAYLETAKRGQQKMGGSLSEFADCVCTKARGLNTFFTTINER